MAAAPPFTDAAAGDAPAPCAPWLPACAARPLHAFGAATRNALATALGHAFIAWHAAWGLAHPAGAAACAIEHAIDHADAQAQADTPRETAPALAPALELGTPLAPWLAQALFGLPQVDTPLARELLGACAQDLPRALAAALGLAELPRRADVLPGPWSGALRVDLPGPLQARLRLPGAVVQAWRSHAGLERHPAPAATARLAPLAAVHDALAGRRLSLSLQLDGCTVGLGSLQDLRPGDVLPLRHRLDAPALLCDAHGQTLLAGHLVRCGTQRAVDLLAAHSA